VLNIAALRMRWRTFGLLKNRGISWLAGDLSASHEGLCSIQLVKYSSAETLVCCVASKITVVLFHLMRHEGYTLRL